WRCRDRPLRTAMALNWLWLFLMDSKGKPDHDFVVVASRLPVDRVEDADGSSTWRTSPGGLVTALEAGVREAGGGGGRRVGGGGAGAGGVGARGPGGGGGGLARARGRFFLGGFRHPPVGAALPGRHRPPPFPPPLVGGVRGGQPPVRAGRGGTCGAGSDRVGARLPAPAGAADAARAARRRADRLLQPHPVPRL